LAAGRATAKKLIDKARAFIVLDHPFFASIMLKRPFTERLDIPTLCVTDGGKIYYNPMFIAKQTAENIVWAVCHEVLHYASGHGPRRGARDPKKWNYAGDMWINDTLNRSNIGSKIEGCIDVPGSADRTCEDIYASFPPDDDGEDEGHGPKGDGPKRKGRGQGGGDSGQSDDPLEDDLEPGEDGDLTPQEIDAQRKIDVAEAAQVAKMKGKLPGILQKFATETIESKTPWHSILERYMTEHTKTETYWPKPNRRYAPDFYVPTQDSVGSMGEMVIQVDVSGSISRQEVQYYNGHMKRIVEQCRPAKVHVMYTDTQVQRHDEFDNPEEVEIEFMSGGGTHMEAGFKYIEDKGITPAVVVTLTDAYDSYSTAPDFPTIWCVSTDQPVPYGEVVRFKMGE
jgi:predicted metal-dependent peptidase